MDVVERGLEAMRAEFPGWTLDLTETTNAEGRRLWVAKGEATSRPKGREAGVLVTAYGPMNALAMLNGAIAAVIPSRDER